MPLDRHHVRSQKLFVRAFANKQGKRYAAFVKRYEEFNEKDICRICRLHHDVVHSFYHMIVDRHIAKIGKPLWQWSWKQATILMNDLEKEFWRWKKRQEAGLRAMKAQGSAAKSLSNRVG
jgi:hypothetical protein